MKCPNRQDLLVTAGELAAILEEQSLRIIDCRFDLFDPSAGLTAYVDAHIPGAVYADLDRDLAAPVDATTGRHPLPDVESATTTFRGLGVWQDSNVVVYDSVGGAIAARAWWMLRWLGHGRVRLLDGGFPAWCAAGYATEAGPVATAAGDFTGSPVDWRILTTADLVDALASGDAKPVVDARDEARFRGEVEPIDAIAGHIVVPFELRGRPQIVADMQRLHLTFSDEPATGEIDPRDLPGLLINSSDFEVGQRSFGRFSANVQSDPLGLRLVSYESVSDSFAVEGSGSWLAGPE